MTRRIVPIVEGQSEVESVPDFLRRVLHDRGVFDLEVDRPIREHRQKLVKDEVFLKRVRMAQYRANCTAVIVVFDADDDAACEVGPHLCELVKRNSIAVPTCVVLAVRELESWLVAGVDSLRGYRGVPSDLSPPEDPEFKRGAKEWLDQRLTGGYKETIDQLPLLHKLDYRAARTRAPSLDKFLRDVDSLVVASVGEP